MMMESIDMLDHQGTLIDIADAFDVAKARTNEERRELIAKAGVYPSELLSYALTAEELREIIDDFGLDADMRIKDDMIATIIDYFEYSQRWIDGDGDGPTLEMYLSSYEDIADGTVERIPKQLHEAVDTKDIDDRLEILFEEATAVIFDEAFSLEPNLLGQHSSGSVPDGEVEQDGQWLLWDNKRRSGPCKLNATTRAKIKSYIDNKDQQHDVEWFLVIAPEFADSAERNALKLEKQTGVDIRLLTADDLRSLADFWNDKFAEREAALPLSIFYGAGEFDLEPVKEALEEMFA